MYLSSDFLDWHSEVEGRTIVDVDALFRAYTIWEHAHDRLRGKPSELDRVDAISALRRSINHRLKSLRSMYNLDCLPTTAARRQILERLQEFGIVRSAIIIDLLNVRNAIEHKDSAPPGVKRCRHYVDMVWYFLKSTDKLVDLRCDDFRFLHEDDRRCVNVSVDYADSWRIKIDAYIFPSLLVDSAANTAIWIEYFSRRASRVSKGMLHVTGTARLEKSFLLSLAYGCFAAAGYWHE